jgi:hypothetical protein
MLSIRWYFISQRYLIAQAYIIIEPFHNSYCIWLDAEKKSIRWLVLRITVLIVCDIRMSGLLCLPENRSKIQMIVILLVK